MTARARLTSWFGVDDDWARPRPALGGSDVAWAVGVGLVGLFTLELVRSMGGLDHTDAPVWTQWLAVSLGAALLLGRRRWPLQVASLAAVHMFVAGVTMPAVMGQASLQVVYFVAILSGVAWARDRALMLAVVSAIVLFMFAWLGWQFAAGSAADELIDDAVGAGSGPFGRVVAAVLLTLVINAIYFGGAIIGGQIAWRSARQRATLEEQAATIAGQADRLRDQAVMDERLRIARELHDVVAHHVSAMGVQAGAARRVLQRDPEAATRALANVEQASRDAVAQMRTLLGTLRDNEPKSAHRGGEPGLADLPDLVEEAPVQVDFDVVADPDAMAAVPTSVGLSLYRTVQEALTNVSRHSTADRASVVLRVEPRRFAEVEILDHGRPRHDSSGSGLGQLGIRERAATLGAEVEIGPRVTGGYRVRFRCPLGEA